MNEFKHKNVGLQLSYMEYHNVDAHEADGQTHGDVIRYDGVQSAWVRSPSYGLELPERGLPAQIFLKTDTLEVYIWYD